MPLCEICGMESEVLHDCTECEAKFCPECGDAEKKLCYDCLGWNGEDLDESYEGEWDEHEPN